jgi:hypothetical protein
MLSYFRLEHPYYPYSPIEVNCGTYSSFKFLHPLSPAKLMDFKRGKLSSMRSEQLHNPYLPIEVKSGTFN